MKKYKIFLIIVGICLICMASYFIGKATHTSNNNTVDESNSYPLLAKRLFIDDPSDTFVNFSLLRTQLKSYFTDNSIEGTLYFEYLPTGTSVRIDGDRPEVGASLLKVPAAMELYKAEELGRISLDNQIEVKQEWLDDAYGELYKKGSGYNISLREAAKIMLEQSDNTALNIVSYATDGLLDGSETPVNAVDVDISVDNNFAIKLGSRGYSSFLKCLYFSCYLTNEHSQELLTYLSNTNFKSRIPAGIDDKNIVVSHKVGNYAQDTQSDCGIIYLPNRNYVLCAMIKGKDDATTDKIIADLSRLSYEFVKAK